MNPSYRNPLFLELRDRLIDTSREERLAYAARAEQLLAELEPKADHPYGFYYARITNLRAPQGDESSAAAPASVDVSDATDSADSAAALPVSWRAVVPSGKATWSWCAAVLSERE